MIASAFSLMLLLFCINLLCLWHVSAHTDVSHSRAALFTFTKNDDELPESFNAPNTYFVLSFFFLHRNYSTFFVGVSFCCRHHPSIFIWSECRFCFKIIFYKCDFWLHIHIRWTFNFYGEACEFFSPRFFAFQQKLETMSIVFRYFSICLKLTTRIPSRNANKILRICVCNWWGFWRSDLAQRITPLWCCCCCFENQVVTKWANTACSTLPYSLIRSAC